MAARDIRPKRYRRIKYKLIGDEDTKIGIVVAIGKRNGKHKDKVWIKTEDNTTGYDVNTDLESWKYAEIGFAKGTKQAEDDTGIRKEKVQFEEDEVNNTFITLIPMREHGREDVKKAKEIELESWDKYEAYEEVEYEDQTVLDSKWIVGEKEDGHIKARLCVKGCQEDRDPRSDSPTAAKDSMKMFLTITANERFEMKSLDVTSRITIGTKCVCSST